MGIRIPPSGPHVVNGHLTQAVIDWISRNMRATEANIGSLNSGLAEARATAEAAQATAAAASQSAQAVAGEALTFSLAASVPVAADVISGAGPAETGSVTVTPTGGTGPYTYAWTLESGDAIPPATPLAATTVFQVTLGNGQALSATYRCTATDSLAATASVVIGVSAISIAPPTDVLA